MRLNRLLCMLFFAVALFTMSVAAQAQVRITVAFGPPALPIYEQPLCPGDGYLWTPGYWAWADEDYLIHRKRQKDARHMAKLQWERSCAAWDAARREEEVLWQKMQDGDRKEKDAEFLRSQGIAS